GVPVPARGGGRDLGAHVSDVHELLWNAALNVALTIAGSDSGGGAGIQADLKTFAAHGVHGASAITAVTAQSSVAGLDYVALEPRMVVAQIAAVAEDMTVAAAKTGRRATAASVERV